MRLTIVLIALALLAVMALLMMGSTDLMQWAVAQQRAFQTQMADGIFALKTGAPGAWFALLGAAAAYGFVHAVGPGHGKYLIGGVGMGTQVSTAHLLSLSVLSSLAQSLWAIALVYGGFFLFEVSAQAVTGLAEDYLAPASYIAIGIVGALLVFRGLRQIAPRPAPVHAHAHAHDHHHHDHHHHHDGQCCDGHAHGPTPEDIADLRGWRDTAALVGSIAIRPCTGAIFLLVIAWQMDIRLAGVAAAITMGLGTALLTSLVAVSSVAARQMTALSSAPLPGARLAMPTLQIMAGIAILWASAGLLWLTL